MFSCHKLIAIEREGCHGPEMGPATDNAREQFCKLCKKPIMGHDGKDKQSCGCEKSMMGWEGKDKQGCECQKPMMGEDGKQTWQGQSKEKPFSCQRSMMGEKGKEGNGEVKIVIISGKP